MLKKMIVLGILVAVMVGVGWAAIPQYISFQGKLTKDSKPVTENVKARISIWDTDGVTATGTEKWAENKELTPNEYGIFHTVLGTATPLNLDFAIPLWVEIQIEADKLLPRQALVSVPYAFTARNLKDGYCQASWVTAAAVGSAVVGTTLSTKGGPTGDYGVGGISGGNVDAIRGSNFGDGVGVRGNSNTGTGVVGMSKSGGEYGVYGIGPRGVIGFNNLYAPDHTGAYGLLGGSPLLPPMTFLLAGTYKYGAYGQADANNHGYLGYYSAPTGGSVIQAGVYSKSPAGFAMYGAAPKGIALDAVDGPMITRGWDLFDSTAPQLYQNMGRWGLFMEPHRLTLGIPNMSGKSVQFITYAEDGKKTNNIFDPSQFVSTPLLEVKSNGALVFLGSISRAGSVLKGSTTRGQVNLGNYSETDQPLSTVGGGHLNKATGLRSTVSGGYSNTASGKDSSIGGGATNNAYGEYSVIGGGTGNIAYGTYSTVGGGWDNRALSSTAMSCTIGGGYQNRVDSDGACVPGGTRNSATQPMSFAAGYRAKAIHDGAFVWSDHSSTTDFQSTAANGFYVRAKGGVVFKTTGGVWVDSGIMKRLDDVAEYMDVLKTENVQRGELVSVKENDKLGRTSRSYDDTLIGVVNDKSAATICLGNDEPRYSDTVRVPVAMVGRIYVKVNNEGGPINIGDYITSSSQPGIGMKAAKPGQTVGIALEAFDGKEGEVLCYVTLGQGNSGKAIAKLENEFQLAKTENKELKLKLGQLEEQLNELAQLVKGDHKFAEVIDADK